MPVQTTRISARYPAIENQTQNFHLAWDVTHFWFGFRRWIPWDKYSTTNHLFQRWSQETPLEKWGWDKNRKEASKECFTSCFCCGESEFYPAGELRKNVKYTPRYTPQNRQESWGIYPPILFRKLFEGCFQGQPAVLLNCTLCGPSGFSLWGRKPLRQRVSNISNQQPLT